MITDVPPGHQHRLRVASSSPARRSPRLAERRWRQGFAHFTHITVGEIQVGIEITREQDTVRAAALETWLEHTAETFRVLPMDALAFRAWARMMHGRTSDLSEDAMIAATAAIHHLTVVTRNVGDFKDFGIATLNPFLTKDLAP